MTRATTLLLTALSAVTAAQVNTTVCNGKTYVYQQLAGYGFVPSDAVDLYSDTIGGIGSAISIPQSGWSKNSDGSYSGTLYAIPDRGWNTEGTLNYQNRIHKFALTLTPHNNATVSKPSGVNIQLTLQNTTLFTDPSGVALTGLDATGSKNFSGFPTLPLATYTGDGYGGSGPGGNRVPVDSEGLVVNADGTFWVSDEYGPYAYLFSAQGTMLQAIQPPAAYLPRRNGSVSFSADSPPFYSGQSDDVSPADPDSGRENNHGLEGLTASPDGKDLYMLLQASLVQEGGLKKSTEQNARLLHYSLAGSSPSLVGEFVVPLPLYTSPSTGSKPNTAAQSEIHYISSTQFLVLARDSGAGAGQSSTQSYYRHADVFDISNATNIMGSTYDCATCSVTSSGGTLKSSIKPAAYCSFLDYNVNSQLNRFGVHNGGAQDQTLLNEKWESLALVPVNPSNGGSDGQFFLFSMSDNDFITQNGYLNFGRYQYADSSGYNLNSQILAFQVQLPTGSTPSK